jgi:hypothetical protein
LVNNAPPTDSVASLSSPVCTTSVSTRPVCSHGAALALHTAATVAPVSKDGVSD